jgi:hypothetical protein
MRIRREMHKKLIVEQRKSHWDDNIKSDVKEGCYEQLKEKCCSIKCRGCILLPE